eukprot:snap_masked-scaffold_8-processed-gene-3.61-mRNA-1 protein AED:0.04 eAED:0.04 QI:0/-1/0/1/-1/1/1/0/174
MQNGTKLNANPQIFATSPSKPKSYEFNFAIKHRTLFSKGSGSSVTSPDPFDAQEIFELIKDIQDPEHPLTLEQINVVQIKNIHVNDEKNSIVVYFTPTVPHCSMSTLIGLCIRVKLLRSLPDRFKVDIFVEPGSHSQEDQVNKQLNDKERVAAALENPHLLSVVNKCLTFSPEN